MPGFKNSIATYLAVFKQCENSKLKKYETFFVIFKHCAVLVIRYIRDLSVFLFQEAPILWFTHSTKAAVLSCPFYGSPLYAFFCWILKMEAFFRPVDHMIYGDTNVVRSSQAEEILKIY